MKILIILFLFIEIIIENVICSSFLQLYLNEPRNNQVYTIGEFSANVYNSTIRYQIFGNIDNNDNIEVCIKILTNHKIDYLSQKCFKYNINESILTVENMIPNQYILVMGIKKDNVLIEDSIVETNFTINRLVDSLPRISLYKGLDILHYAKNEDNSNITIEYFLSKSMIPLNNIEICLKVLTLDGKVLIDFYCMETKYSYFTIKNINIGEYNIILILANKNNNMDITYYKDTEIIVKLNFNTIDKYLPTLQFTQLQYENVIDKSTSIADIIVPFVIEEKALNVNDQLEMCINITDLSKSNVMLSQCSQSLISPLSISNLRVGNYKLTLSFVNRKTKLEYTTHQTELVVHFPQEFIPTYEYKQIESYNSIPSGLEVILPIDGSKKMARIPSPWRLQLPMPAPCKYFLRMDIYKDTKLIKILTTAEKICQLAEGCISLISDQEILDSYATAESSNLFNINKSLKINDICI